MDEMREQIIKKDKTWLVSTLNSAGDAIITCEQNGQLDFANAEALNILGLSLLEILGKPFHDVFKIYQQGHDNPVEFFRDGEIDNLKKSIGLPRSSYYKKPNGDVAYLSAHLSPLLSDSGEFMGTVVVFRDISKIIKAENTIKNERNNLKLMFDLLPTCMVVLSSNAKILRVNLAFLRTFELEENIVIGKGFGDVLGCVFSYQDGCGDSQNCPFCGFRRIINKVIVEEKVIKDKSIKVKFKKGSMKQNRFLNISVLPVVYNDMKEYIITMEDITEQIYYEKSLKEARESSLSILDSLPVMIYRIDREQHCDFINQTFKTFMNISKDSFYDALRTHMKPIDHERFMKTLKKSLSAASIFNIELELMSPYHSYQIFRGIGRPYYDKNHEYAGMIGLFLDIDDERKAEELFRQSQNKYFSLFKYMASSITYYKAIHDENENLVDAQLVEMNLATEELFGISRDNALNKNVSELLCLEIEENQGLISRFAQVLSTGENLYLAEYYLVKLKRWVEVSIYSPEKGYIAVLAADIDSKKNTEIKLKAAMERSEEANRAKSEFLANMSHEIRTPLNGIVGMIDLTALEPLSDEQRDNLRTAKGCVQSLINIINDILDFAKIEAGKLMINPMSFNLLELIDLTIKTHKKHAIEKCLDLSVEYGTIQSAYVIGDSMRLKQILNNLISNAIKFTNSGSVKVRVNQMILDEKNEVIQEISITDTGIGIDPDHYPMLFKSFTQIDGSYTREYGGTGLGLVITKQLVEMMGGEVKFSSQLGTGSTFTIQIPMVVTKNAGETAANIQSDVNFSGSRVLLVEDDRVNQIVIQKMLESLGAEVDLAVNGVEGVRMASLIEYNVILMDIQMPIMDGIQATQIIRGIEPKTKRHLGLEDIDVSKNSLTPIIALTAFALQGDEAIFKASGMDGYLSKPLDRYQMQVLLKDYLSNLDSTKINSLESIIKGFNHHSEQISDSSSNLTFHKKELKEIDQMIENLKNIMDEGNFIMMEVIAHQLKGHFEKISAEELKNLVFKMELELRKDRIENVAELLDRIEQIWMIMNNCNEWEIQNNEENINC
jgi:PAS domain S-box-containing protein